MLGYSMVKPATWQLTPASRPWTYASGNHPGDGMSDVYQSPGHPSFRVTSQELPAGMNADQWL